MFSRYEEKFYCRKSKNFDLYERGQALSVLLICTEEEKPFKNLFKPVPIRHEISLSDSTIKYSLFLKSERKQQNHFKMVQRDQ
jgi:hypothetical protein